MKGSRGYPKPAHPETYNALRDLISPLLVAGHGTELKKLIAKYSPLLGLRGITPEQAEHFKAELQAKWGDRTTPSKAPTLPQWHTDTLLRDVLLSLDPERAKELRDLLIFLYPLN